MRGYATLMGAAATLLTAAAVVAGPPATPKPRTGATPPNVTTPTPFPSARTNPRLNLPPCSATGTLKFNTNLLLANAAGSHSPQGKTWKSAYSGSMTLGINLTTEYFRLGIHELKGGSPDPTSTFYCGFLDILPIHGVKGQTWSYQLKCWSEEPPNATRQGKFLVSYKATTDYFKEAYCDGVITFAK